MAYEAHYGKCANGCGRRFVFRYVRHNFGNELNLIMKTTLLFACAGLLLATGCSRHYNVTLNNGATVTALTKPKLTPDGMYVFKDGSGKLTEVNAMRVKLIEPTSIAKEHTSKFNQPFQYR